VAKIVLVSALIIALLTGCSGGDDSISDSTIIDDLTNRLVQENAAHYAFGCVDFDGSVQSEEYLPDAIAREAAIEHNADAWAAETTGVVLGGDERQQYVVIHDPASEATDAEDFEEREIAYRDGTLTCFVPKNDVSPGRLR
jgi:hypothetical protein